MRSGARCVGPMLRPHARGVATACARHVAALPHAAPLLRAPALRWHASPCCVCGVCVQRRCPGLHAWWLRPHDTAIRARAQTRCADAQCGPALHARILRPSTLRGRALREGRNRRDCAALLPMCEIADLPCACKRREYLRSAYGCAVLVQALAHAHLLGAPRALAPCVRTTLTAILLRDEVRPCPVCASAARACALRSRIVVR